MLLGATVAATLSLLGLGASALAGTVPRTAAPPNPADFTAHVDNPWFPLEPGTTYVFTGVRDGKASRDVVTVTHQVKLIEGVPCVVVKDRLYLNGRLHERTTDWYTQDTQGNVWYYGESTAELDRNGHVTSTEGSWQAGVDGAVPGIFMPAHPKVGQAFRQEYYKGHAEDHFRILSLRATVSVPYVSSKRGLLTKEWTPLEPAVIDHKVYVRGIGVVREETVKGGQERAELVSVRKAR
jgi:hypothetical protein